jgi:hypothetical protein
MSPRMKFCCCWLLGRPRDDEKVFKHLFQQGAPPRTSAPLLETIFQREPWLVSDPDCALFFIHSFVRSFTHSVLSIVHENVLCLKILGQSHGAPFSPQSAFFHATKWSGTGANDPLIDTYNTILQPAKHKERMKRNEGQSERISLHCVQCPTTTNDDDEILSPRVETTQETYRSAMRKARPRSWVQK